LEQLFTELSDLITHEIEAYRKLLVYTEDEKEKIIKNLVNEIDSAVISQRAVLKTINKLESEREQLFREFSEKSGEMQPSLRDIIEAAPDEYKEKLTDLSADLQGTASDLRKASNLNKKLIETQAKYVSFCVNLIAGPMNSMETYSVSGRLSGENTAKCRLIDQTV
jgi:flagellar biosynthesis/type III secretory pathway chaperone